MNEILLLLFLLGVITPFYAQTDTVFIKKLDGDKYVFDTIAYQGNIMVNDVLVGTAFLTRTDKMIRLLNDGFWPLKMELLEQCSKDYVSIEELSTLPKINNVTVSKDTLTIDCQISDNCCATFLGEAESIGDTLNLTYITYNKSCSCSCAHCIRYQFLNRNWRDVKYVMIKRKEETITPIKN